MSYKALVDLLCKRRDWDALLIAMERHASVPASESGGDWDCDSDGLSAGFTLAIQRMEKAKELARAVSTIAQRERLRVPPSVPLFTTSVKILLRAGFPDCAEQLCWEMKSVGLEADAAMYRAVVSGFAHAGRLDRALQGYKEMRASGYDPSPETLKAIFNGLAREGRLEEGQNLFQELLLSGFIPKSYPPTLLACALHGKEGIRKAPEVLQIMKEEGFVFHAASFNSVLRALMDLGNKEAAFEFFKEMPGKMNVLGQTKEVPNMSSYRILICGLCNFGEINTALEYFRVMWVAGFVPTREIFDSLLLGLGRAGMIDEITFVCDCVAKFSVKLSVDVQKLIFSALSKSKGLDKTAKVFQRLKDRGCLGHNT